ncbi:unnamed protein product [Rhizophagus irregularis]|nr:unnamed protein product [Rhizophagus irregularis]
MENNSLLSKNSQYISLRRNPFRRSHFAERKFHRRDISPKGYFAEWIFHRMDISQNAFPRNVHFIEGHFTENDIFP